MSSFASSTDLVLPASAPMLYASHSWRQISGGKLSPKKWRDFLNWRQKRRTRLSTFTFTNQIKGLGTKSVADQRVSSFIWHTGMWPNEVSTTWHLGRICKMCMFSFILGGFLGLKWESYVDSNIHIALQDPITLSFDNSLDVAFCFFRVGLWVTSLRSISSSLLRMFDAFSLFF